MGGFQEGKAATDLCPSRQALSKLRPKTEADCGCQMAMGDGRSEIDSDGKIFRVSNKDIIFVYDAELL